MNAPRFLIAKYIPDLRRNEPRNIGVVVWSQGLVGMRFLDSPKFVENSRTYKEWVQFWTTKLSKDALPGRRGNEPTPKTSPDYLDVFRETGKENYVLVDGGFLLEQVEAADLPDLTDHLFETLVLEGPEGTLADASRRGNLRD